MDAGSVNVRFTVENAEVVRQALSNLGKDGEKALRQFDNTAQAQSGFKALHQVLDGVKDKAREFAGEGGAVANFLMRWGPLGIAAGAGLGVAYLALEKFSRIGEQFGQTTQAIRDNAGAVGLSTLHYQALAEEGQKLGLTQEQIGQAMTKAAAGLLQARDAEGELFDQVRRISPELGNQLIRTRDLATMLDILSAAYAKADATQRAALGRQLSHNPLIGSFLGAIHEGGGTANIAEHFKPEAIPTETINRAAKLRVEIEQIKEQTDKLWGQAFGPSALETQKASANLWHDIAEEIKNAADNLAEYNKQRQQPVSSGGAVVDTSGVDGLSGLQFELNKPGAGEDRQKRVDELEKKQKELNGALEDFIKKEQEAAGKPWADAIRVQVAALREELGKVNAELDKAKPQVLPATIDVLPPTRPSPSIAPEPDGAGSGGGAVTAKARLNLYRETIGVLGEAATAAEHYHLRTLEVDAAVEEGGVAERTRNRALEAAVLALNATVASQRERLGVLSEEELLSVRLADLQVMRAKGYIQNDAEMAAAERMVRKEVKDTIEALQVRTSPTPALKRLELDAADLGKTLDQELAGSLRSSTSDLIEMAKGTETVSKGLQNMGMRILEAVANAMLLKSFVGPLSSLASAGIQSFLPSAKGNVFENGDVRPFAAGGVIDRQIYFPSRSGWNTAGEFNRPEGIFPLRRGPGGELGVAAYGGGANVTVPVNVSIVNALAGSSPQVSASSNSDGGIDVGVIFDERIANDIESGGPVSQVFERKYGLNRVASAFG